MRVKTLMRGDKATKERLRNWSEYLLSVGFQLKNMSTLQIARTNIS